MNFNFSTENLFETDKGRTLIIYWLKRIFIDDWVMKLVALIITFALWLGVTGLQEPTTRSFNNVSLSPIMAKGLEITNDSFIREVDLELSGDERKINNLNPRDLVVTYDLTDLQAGEREVQLTPQNINIELPSGVRVTKIIPEKLAVKVENIVEDEVSVKAETEGKLAGGFEIYSIRIIPEKVRIRGPKSVTESLKFISTEKIDLTGRRGDFIAQKVPINVNGEKISLIDSVAVNVAFRIGKERIAVKFTVPYETEKRHGRADITLYGPDNLIEGLSTDDILIAEDEEDPLKLRVILPEDIRSEVEVRKTNFRDNKK
jgi:YbbR domain-containing protein